MKKISFNSANFVGQTSDYTIYSEDWSIGEKSTSETFRNLDTFEHHFDTLIGTIKQLGFDYMDLWHAHLSWQWATDRHLEIAAKVLKNYGMEVLSYVGEFGNTKEEFTRACRLVKSLGFDLMGGGSTFFLNHREEAVEILKQEGVRFALENHPGEPTVEDCQRVISGTPAGLVGMTIDTGWFMTYGIAPDKAVEALLERVMHIHLKDIKAKGAHDTCAYGEGIVPLRACVRLLEENGYRGNYSIEHEPYTFDPSQDCQKSKALLQSWLEEILL